MRKKTQLTGRIAVSLAACFFTFANFAGVAEASDGEDYITIKVHASDENEGLKYAIDSNDPAAFSTQNEFTIPAGTSHTIYVKDAAGNVTSQTYSPSKTTVSGTGTTPVGEDTQQINIDLELGNENKEDYSNYEYLTDDPAGAGTGTGTVTTKTTTDGSDNAEKVFYTVTADSGEVFYMVIDQSQSTDNVYLLNAVTLNDLKSLAEDDPSGANTPKENDGEDNLLEALRKNNSDDGDSVQDTSESGKKPTSSIGNNIIFLVILVIGGGVFYYLKVYKNKKDEMMDTMDAMDMEEFEAEEEDDDEIEFDETDDEEKDRFLSQLVEEEDIGNIGNGREESDGEEDGEEEFFNMDPEEYAQSGKGNRTENEPDEGAFQFDDESEEEEEEED